MIEEGSGAGLLESAMIVSGCAKTSLRKDQKRKLLEKISIHI